VLDQTLPPFAIEAPNGETVATAGKYAGSEQQRRLCSGASVGVAMLGMMFIPAAGKQCATLEQVLFSGPSCIFFFLV
jgi:hypothetical protein